MDALLSAYEASDNESESEGEGGDRAGKRAKLIGPLPGGLAYCPPSSSARAFHTTQHVAGGGLARQPPQPLRPHPGRYVSKRERALAAAAAAASDGPAALSTSPVLPLPESRRVLSSQLPKHMQKRLQYLEEGASLENYLPKGLFAQLDGHKKGVNAVRWSPTHGCLLATAGVDEVAKIWNVWKEAGQQCVRRISAHTASVKDVQWSSHGDAVLSCGFDKTTRLTDVETGAQRQMFAEDQFVTVAKFHPLQHDTFLTGGSQGVLRLWDLRSGSTVMQLSRGLGQILDLDFNQDGRQFVSSSDLAQQNSGEKGLIVWSLETQVPLSNQVYLEAYTCPAVRYHPHEDSFIAQSHGNYIAIFSSRPPFKMNKYTRYEGHQVAGFPIRCNFSPDGEYIVTGSSDGATCFYSWRTSKMLRKLSMPESVQSVCTDAVYHPFMPCVVAACNWAGAVYIYN